MRHLALVVVAVLLALGLASQVEAQTGPYSQVVDNATQGRFAVSNGWNTSARGDQHYAKNFRLAKPARAGGVARFKVKTPTTRYYAVYVRWPAAGWYNAATPIGVRTTSGMKWTRVDQRRNGGKWVKVGVYRIERGDRYSVRVSRRAKGTGWVVADAVKIVEARRPSRAPDSMLGRPIHDRASAERYARSVGSSRYIMETIPLYYKLAPKTGIAPDVLVAQAILETGRGRYGGDSKPWNMAGIKKGGRVGDEPRDFERPTTAYQGVRMHVNHMAAYTGKKPIGTPHDRFYDARAAQKNRGWWVTRISQLGGGAWATDTTYALKIRRILDDMAKY
ncbi:MAG: glucosaminidase domain-containing protein [Rubrobacteraceae bacterium]